MEITAEGVDLCSSWTDPVGSEQPYRDGVRQSRQKKTHILQG